MITNWALPIIGVWASVLIASSARKLTGRDRVAWTLTGGTALAFAAGQATLAWYALTETTMPAWGLPDLFFLAGFGSLLAFLLLLPQSAQSPFERVRLMLDMATGVIALFVLLWVTTVGQLAAAASRGDARSIGDLVYTVVDGLILAGLILVLLRPAKFKFDPRLLLAGLALGTSSAVDVINIGTGSFVVAGEPLSALWLIAFGLITLLGGIVGSPPKRRLDHDPRPRRSGMVAVYLAVLGVIALLMYDLVVGLSPSNRAVEGVGVVVLGALIVARQTAAIKENRMLVEHARDRLISSVSHELRTPLTVAIGFTELLRTRGDSLDPSERAEIVTLAGQSLAELSRLVSDLLMVQRGHLDLHSLKLGPVNAGDIASRAQAVLSELGVGLEVDIADDLKVVTDADRAVQVLAALLDNAFKYGKAPVRLSVRSKDGMVVFEVHDSGSGVPARHNEDIWQAFERGAHRLDAQRPGTGLGLTTARAVTQALGGSAEYHRSAEFGGACFLMALPQT